MDAAPLFVADEFGAWASQLDAAASEVRHAIDVLSALPLGGSAVGTGLNVPAGWAEEVIGRSGRGDRSSIASRSRSIRIDGRWRGLCHRVRVVAGRGRRAHEDLQRSAAPVVRADDRVGRAAPPGAATGQLDHAGQGEPGDPGGDPAGRGTGARQRRHGDVRARRRGRCSSTPTSHSSPTCSTRASRCCPRHRWPWPRSASPASRSTQHGSAPTPRRHRRWSPGSPPRSVTSGPPPRCTVRSPRAGRCVRFSVTRVSTPRRWTGLSTRAAPLVAGMADQDG